MPPLEGEARERMMPMIRRLSLALSLVQNGAEIHETATCPRCGGYVLLARVVLPGGTKGSAAICADCKYRAYAQREGASRGDHA